MLNSRPPRTQGEEGNISSLRSKHKNWLVSSFLFKMVLRGIIFYVRYYMEPIITQQAKTLRIKEQILYNDSCGLTIEFAVVENDEEAPFRLRIYGDILPFGNRQFEITKDGIIGGAGTALTACPFPFDKLD